MILTLHQPVAIDPWLGTVEVSTSVQLWFCEKIHSKFYINTTFLFLNEEDEKNSFVLVIKLSYTHQFALFTAHCYSNTQLIRSKSVFGHGFWYNILTNELQWFYTFVDVHILMLILFLTIKLRYCVNSTM